MPLSKEETFHIEEYKSLREEITIRLKDRLEFNRWGCGLALLYSYIFANPTKPILFYVPVALSFVFAWYLRRQENDVFLIAQYTKSNLEPWLAAARTQASPGPGGWETALRPANQAEPWLWWPATLWVVVFVATLAVALLRPWLSAKNWL